jgi:hypothetical protein
VVFFRVNRVGREGEPIARPPLPNSRSWWSHAYVAGIFSLKLVCLVCRDVLGQNGERVPSTTKHRVRIVMADENCTECKEPYVEACIRADGSQLVACKQLHTMETRAQIERAGRGRTMH